MTNDEFKAKMKGREWASRIMLNRAARGGLLRSFADGYLIGGCSEKQSPSTCVQTIPVKVWRMEEHIDKLEAAK